MALPEDLHIAIVLGQIGILNNFLNSENADVISANAQDESLLHTACAHGRMEIVELLIDNNAPLKFQDQNGDTPLHVAVRKGNLELVRRLLSIGADHSLADNHGSTPLHSAAVNGFSDIVQLLIKFGADVNASTIDNNRPIHMATSGNKSQALIHLLEAGADTEVQNLEGFTAVHIALLSGYEECASDLLACGADFDTIKDINGHSAFELAVKLKATYFVNLFNAVQVQRKSVIQAIVSGAVVPDIMKLLDQIRVRALNLRNIHAQYQQVISEKAKEITDKADVEIEEWKKINPQVEKILIKQPQSSESQVQAPKPGPSSPRSEPSTSSGPSHTLE